MSAPVFNEYFADPFVLQLADGTYAAFGTGRPPAAGPLVFECLTSVDLLEWRSIGGVLERLPESFGDEYWAPEVIEAEGAWWMYYSVGHGDTGHHLRVARADSPFGPFRDLGVDLTPGERFAIDAHPFRDIDGALYLYFARDVLDAIRPGTQLAVAPLTSMTTLGPVSEVLAPFADWQLFERSRALYNRTFDWHTLEGPAVVRRHDVYWMTYSAGAWTGPGYAVSWAVAPSPSGPWTPAPAGSPALLATGLHDLIGPGHNSLVSTPSGRDAIAFHAWDAGHDARKLHVHHITFEPEGPWVDGPIQGPSLLAP